MWLSAALQRRETPRVMDLSASVGGLLYAGLGGEFESSFLRRTPGGRGAKITSYMEDSSFK
jgi:hypothetical protein